MPKKIEPVSFEQALSNLESIVKQMEKGDMPLEESLAAFEKGVELTRQCQVALKEAEQRVSILTEKPEGDKLEPFEGQDES